MKHAYIYAALALLVATGGAKAATPQDLDTAIARGQWNDAAEIAHEILEKNPRQPGARLTGAYALFQAGYPNAALTMLKPLSPTEWRQLPRGTERLAEIVLLFQKKIPLTVLPARVELLDSATASPALKDEISFARGRVAFEKRDEATAKAQLESVSHGSRFFSQARYLLATLAVQRKDYSTASAEFSKLFDPAVLNQSTEFWQDVGGTGGQSDLSPNLRIDLNADSLEEGKKVGELALLGLARVAYASKQYEAALGFYGRLTKEATLGSRGALEKIWTLLALNRHEEAQKAASELAVSDTGFEAVEARTVRALVLTDAGRTDEARSELEAFEKIHEQSLKQLNDWRASQVDNALPAFLKSDLARDSRLQAITRYQKKLIEEQAALRAEDHKLFPVYARLGPQLEPLLIQARTLAAKLTQDHVARRRADLDELLVQARLIRAETYLEDREKLRAEFRALGPGVSESKQLEHDQRLVQLLERAVREVDSVIERVGARRVRLEFRQSELLWELSSAKGILSQSTKSDADRVAADAYKERSVRLAQNIADKHHSFERHGQALFFAGFAQTDLGQAGAGFATLEKFVKLYPKHPHTPDAYRIMADIRFDANQFRLAEDSYKRVLDFNDSPVAGYALYKIGWCAYNLKDFSRALLAFEKANQWAQGRSDSNHLLSLQREARNDLIALYAEVGDHRKALDYFSKFFQGDSAGLLAALARELDRVGHFEKSSDLYKTLIALDPTAKENMAYQAAIINGSYRLRRWPQVIEAARLLNERYGGLLSAPQASAEDPATKAENTLREALLVQQFEASRAPTPDTLERVEELDELYLKTFAQWPASQDPLYRHAHFLLEQNKVDRAVTAFQDHWERFQATLQEPLREEALRNLVHALEKQESASGETAKPGTPLTASAERILDYAGRYEKEYSKQKHARSIRFLRSGVLFKYARLDDGARIAQSLFDESPADDVGKRSFKNLRVAYYDRKDWKQTFEWSSRLAESKEAGMSLYASELAAVREESLFLWAEATTDDVRAAELYQKLARDPRMPRLKDKALFNAFIRLARTGDRVSALSVANELEKKHPNFESLPQIAGGRAAFYQEAGDYVRAGELLETFLKQPPKDTPVETQAQARFNLALIDEALGKSTEAQAGFKALLATGGATEAQLTESKRALERLQSQAKPTSSVAVAGDWPALEKQFTAFVKQPLPARGELAQKIQKGGESLQTLAKRLIDLKSFEPLCALPFLYDSYGIAVVKLAEAPELKPADAAALKPELAKIAAPLAAKTSELADQCLREATQAEHDGPYFRKALARWGWTTDAKLAKTAQAATERLEKGYPWLDPSPTKRSEGELIEANHKGKGDEDSRYALGRLRLMQKKPGLARLTFVDALTKSPGSGRLLNALAAIAITQRKSSDELGLTATFERAGAAKSDAAWANLAYLHLKGGRLGPALNALTRALDGNVFDEDDEMKRLVKELTHQ